MAKARLLQMAIDTRPGYHVMLQASNMVRERPWHGVGLALVAGVALGLAPRAALTRLSLMAPIAARLLAGIGAGIGPATRSVVGAADRARASANVGRVR